MRYTRRMSKHDMRKKLLSRRQGVSADAAEATGRTIAAQLPALVDWRLPAAVHVYKSVTCLGEVSTRPIVTWLQTKHPELHLEIGQASPGAPFPTRQFDVIFVPVLGFDRGGFRLGMGGGWYDRWLATQPQALKIGLAYAWAEVACDAEAHDIQLDIIVTDEEIIVARASAQ